MREYRTVRLEVGLTTPFPTNSQDLAKTINRASHITIVACQSYQKAISEKDTGGRVTSNRWMVAPSPTKNSQNSSSSFRLVSSWIVPPAPNNSSTAQQAKAIAEFLRTVESMDSVVMNKNVGVRIHVRARGMTSEVLKRLVQLFVKYEAVLDSLVPESRRTGSPASNKFFQSIRNVLLQNTATAGGGLTSSTPTNTITLKDQLNAIELCPNSESLVELVNPTGPHYKLNLRHVTAAGIRSGGVESYIEFRQHSLTGNRQKIQSWISLCCALVERAVSTNKSPLAFHSTRKLETQVLTLFSSVVKDPKMRAFYQKRRKVLDAGESSKNGNRTASPASRKPKKKAKVTATADAGAALSSSVATEASTKGTKKGKKKEPNHQCGCCLEKLDSATGRRNKVCSCQEHGHVFCSSCIVKYAQNELFANHNADLTCIAMGGNCQSPYNSRQLDACLPINVKHKLLEVQYENIAAKKNGTVLWECPQCGAKGFVPKKEKTFSCPVGSCRFHSCRSCGEAAHPSQKCSEVEKQVVANARKSVEEAMSAVIIRECPKCRSRVIWDSGCDHVTCQRCSTTLTGLPEYGQNRQAVRNAGTTALDQVEDRSTKKELTGIVESLV